MTKYGFTRASSEVIAVRVELADDVVHALRRAGLPAFWDGEGSGGPEQPGAVVYVDPDAETASASVSVGWRCDTGLVQAAVDALASGSPLDAPAVRHPGMIGLHMQGALIGILLSAGIIATPENDRTNPDHVLVFGRMTDLPPALRPTFVPPGSRPGRA
ncbi:hypothetical protein E2C00_20480 [Streptomyces sp. WAC05374]|uniref:hypothetical protein n=1 Tax=Streptomyces sp. WAC05374 TaxID=2487420 RepID=UPI000F87AF30|nr:hypothetical protein [Streptomyces sp. WAC05374]RST11266.1 hypothetical protein EF905_25540 [Streptomyces sp. WAC05374]TDF38032.1 hypothetical protein E2B92_28055 [Streptomyces sp. WAC05374]TDF53490.1 hypothetical protein E2C00_20480 [Streptomyces sp. WAC05374]TDF59337.1 hypothetical protein E2C02_05960 [Streptomyces sp. WAC05374]